MKAGNKTALTTVRNVLGEISTCEKSGKTPVELDDAQVTALLQKEAAQRRDTPRIYTGAGVLQVNQRATMSTIFAWESNGLARNHCKFSPSTAPASPTRACGSAGEGVGINSP
jgi:hypothetical protein